MNPWEYQKALRESAKWIFDTWVERYERRKEVNWVPWIITAGNTDTNPKYPQRDAERIFQDLWDRGLFSYCQTRTGVLPSPTNEEGWKQLIEDDSWWSVSGKPFLMFLYEHPRTTIIVTSIFALIYAFFSPWAETYSKYIYVKWFPGLSSEEYQESHKPQNPK